MLLCQCKKYPKSKPSHVKLTETQIAQSRIGKKAKTKYRRIIDSATIKTNIIKNDTKKLLSLQKN